MNGNLNCRPGDLAITVPPMASHVCGKIVMVLRAALPVEEIDGRTFRAMGERAVWVVRDSRLGDFFASDRGLRPIRDQPGDDETLRWAGLPKPLAHRDGELDALRELGGVPA